MSAPSAGQELVEQVISQGVRTAVCRKAGVRVSLSTGDADRLGVLLESIRIDRIPGTLSRAMLRRRLLKLAEKLDYLPEKLALVEHDPERTGALMRSDSPRWRGEDREYFELRVEMNRATTFQRFRQPPGGLPRQSAAILLDRTNLARLVDDLVAAVA
ncbi:MAG: hypothetical protein ACE5HD_07910 [Acidobacteriota bacterium]